ncbi:hypothetical protein [Fusobacterium polymorphum]|uniref:Uncharacterized protein n=1 Tax=Fusobacterium nucleatum subsp. polymorphum TaxID=76857 RepID=A0A2C6B4M1_FUSNP|nr:hypothetical protein [Fusobacterium polymorphum]PHH99506.1 hypothetical protein CA836_07380 [Fusobacterium polymorphum]
MTKLNESKLIEKGKLNSLSESSETIKKLKNLKKELEKIREKIKGNNLSDLLDLEYNKIKEDFKNAYKEFDLAKNREELDDIAPNIKKAAIPLIFKYLLMTNEIQTLISRIDSKLLSFELNKNYKFLNKQTENQKETFQKITKKYASLEKEASKIKEETSNLRDNVLTISSIIFTAFTLIQLNFVAFQNSNDYNVLDRLILFSGINLFLLISITAIMSIIKRLLSSENKEHLFIYELKLAFGFLIFLFLGSLLFKSCTKNILVDEEKILNMEIKIKELEEKIASTLNNNNTILEENKNLKNEINTLKDKTVDLKEKISDLKNNNN